MKKFSFILAVVILIAGSAGISYGRGVGTTGAQFLKIDPSARTIFLSSPFFSR